MSAKTLTLAGPELAYSSAGPLKYQAITGGTWSVAERAQLEWTIALDDGAPQPLPVKGERQELLLKRLAAADRITVCVHYAKESVQANIELAVIRMAVAPFKTLAAPIDAANISTRQLQPSKRTLYVAKVGTTQFNVGSEQSYPKKNPTRKGLYLLGVPPGPQFRAGAFKTRFGHWSTLLEATTAVEGKQSFVAGNTYDSAFLTFGFIQFTPNFADANLIKLLWIWLARSDAKLYFPELKLVEVDGKMRIHNQAGTLLEDGEHNTKLCEFLKPDPKVIGPTEINYVARLVHLCRQDPQACVDQVKIAVGNFKTHLKALHGKGIDKRPDYLCALICDIRNQGRAGTAEVAATLVHNGETVENDKAYKALLKFGAKKYPERVTGLKKQLNKMIADNRLGAKWYDEATGEFVPK